MNHPSAENIKIRLTLKRAPAPGQNAVIVLEKWRALLYRLGLVGEYQTEKIGYGHLSSRFEKKYFIISGSQTGHLANLQPHHYTRVIECDLKRSTVAAEGLIPPCQESLGHYGIYQKNPHIQYIFQVNHKELWQRLGATSSFSVKEKSPFGSNGMVDAINEFVKHKETGLFITQNEEDGIISFGSQADEVGKNILDLYRKLATWH